MAEFDTFHLGNVMQTAEAIKGMRRQSITDQLRQRYLGQQIQAGEQRMQQQATQFTQEQQIENTRLLNAAMAEIAQDARAAERWVPLLQERGVMNPNVDWRSQPVEVLQENAKKVFDSTSQALSAYSRSASKNSLVHSVFQGQNGNAWYIDRNTGRAVDTGTPMQKFSPQVIERAGGLDVYDPNVRNVTTSLATPEQQIGAAADLAGAKAGATTTATAEAEKAITAPQRAEKARQLIAGIDNTISTAQDAIRGIDWKTVGPVGAISKAVPGTPAFNLAQTILTIKANVGFDRLQQMRDNSPTGGALGQVAVQELDALQSSIANLNQAQNGEQLERNLKKVIEHYGGWKRAVQQANAADSRVQELLDRYAPKK